MEQRSGCCCHTVKHLCANRLAVHSGARTVQVAVSKMSKLSENSYFTAAVAGRSDERTGSIASSALSLASCGRFTHCAQSRDQPMPVYHSILVLPLNIGIATQSSSESVGRRAWYTEWRIRLLLGGSASVGILFICTAGGHNQPLCICHCLLICTAGRQRQPLRICHCLFINPIGPGNVSVAGWQLTSAACTEQVSQYTRRTRLRLQVRTLAPKSAPGLAAWRQTEIGGRWSGCCAHIAAPRALLEPLSPVLSCQHHVYVAPRS
jgi:hypothetical protein